MHKPNVSQSLIKVITDYYHEDTLECGLKIRKQYFDKIPTKQSDAQKLGIYFEYLCTGYLPKGAEPPQPEMVYKGTAREKLAADYERANESAELYKKIIADYGIEILSNGEYMLDDGVSGITDLRAIFKGKECIIDIKYSALFDDKFSEFGWHIPSLNLKSKLMLQPIHYKWLAEKIYGIPNMPFYFFVFSAKDSSKVKIIEVNIDEAHIMIHEDTIEKMRRYIQFHYDNPHTLKARPKFLRCMECPYVDNCEEKIIIPQVDKVDY